MTTQKLSLTEKRAARRLNVSAADLHYINSTSSGAAYGLYNGYYYCTGIFSGYSKPEIYRALLRQLLTRCGFYDHI